MLYIYKTIKDIDAGYIREQRKYALTVKPVDCTKQSKITTCMLIKYHCFIERLQQHKNKGIQSTINLTYKKTSIQTRNRWCLCLLFTFHIVSSMSDHNDL